MLPGVNHRAKVYNKNILAVIAAVLETRTNGKIVHCQCTREVCTKTINYDLFADVQHVNNKK